MKLRNKKTGEIVEFEDITRVYKFIGNQNVYNSLAELNEEWEDYKELKKYYYVTSCGEITHRGYRLWENESLFDKKRKEIGNYFETEEEAEKAVEKLKAWKRLKDKGFRFTGWATNEGIRGIDFEVPDSFFSEHNHSCISDETRNDLDLLFGGEE